MKRLLSLPLLIVAFLLAAAGLAAAAGPEIGPFSTSGYTTNLVPAAPIPGLPSVVPSDFAFLPSGQIKFRITAQGGPAVDDDNFCMATYLAPCNLVCLGLTGKVCGTDGYFAGGSFRFEEWGVVDATFSGANFGKLQISTAEGDADLLFGGQVGAAIVQGSFRVEDGSGAYVQNEQDEGIYTGNAGFVFGVGYAPRSFVPCLGGICPNRCAVFGATAPDLSNGDLRWVIENEGEKTLTLNSLIVNWPQANGALTKVKLGSKTLSQIAVAYPSLVPGVPGQFAVLKFGWLSRPRDRQIGANSQQVLKLEFANTAISQTPSDYTLTAGFAEGCAVPFAAFPPPAP